MPFLTLPLAECIFLSITAFWSLLAVLTTTATHESSYYQLFTVPFFSALAGFCLSRMAFSLHHGPALAPPLEIELGPVPPRAQAPSPMSSSRTGPIAEDFMRVYSMDSSVHSLVRYMKGIKGRAEEMQRENERERRVAARDKLDKTTRWVGHRISRWILEPETEEEREMRRQWKGRQPDF